MPEVAVREILDCFRRGAEWGEGRFGPTRRQHQRKGDETLCPGVARKHHAKRWDILITDCNPLKSTRYFQFQLQSSTKTQDNMSLADRVNSLPPRPRRTRGGRLPVQYADVYVDDEILLGQGMAVRLNRLRLILLHINDLVCRPNDSDDYGRREPISMKKLRQGEACFLTYHTVQGWTVDTLSRHWNSRPTARQD
jgi:hypothetical protein